METNQQPPNDEINMIDIGNGETVPEVIYIYEKGPDGKIHRKKKRLIKKDKKDELTDI